MSNGEVNGFLKEEKERNGARRKKIARVLSNELIY